MESKFPEYISQGQRPFRDKWKFTGIFQLINLVNCFVQDICASVSAFESDPLLLGRWFHVASFCPFYILFVIESGCETQQGGETISATDSNVRHPHEHHSSMFLNLVYPFQFVRYSVPSLCGRSFHTMPQGFDSSLTKNTEKWHAILNPQSSSSCALFSVVLSHSRSPVRAGWPEMAFWVTLVGTSFWVLVGKGALDKWWCASHDCLPLPVTPPSDALGKSQITAVLNEKCQSDVKDTLLLCVCFADCIVALENNPPHSTSWLSNAQLHGKGNEV